jgi:hypothetical protein
MAHPTMIFCPVFRQIARYLIEAGKARPLRTLYPIALRRPSQYANAERLRFI